MNANEQAIADVNLARKYPEYSLCSKQEGEFHEKINIISSKLPKGMVIGEVVYNERWDTPVTSASFRETSPHVPEDRCLGLPKDKVHVVKVLALGDLAENPHIDNLEVGDKFIPNRAAFDTVFFGPDVDVYIDNVFIGHGYHSMDIMAVIVPIEYSKKLKPKTDFEKSLYQTPKLIKKAGANQISSFGKH